VTAEASTALGVLDESDYAAIERKMDQLCRTQPVSAMCQYARHSTSGARLREVVGVHLVGIRETNLRITSDTYGTAFGGEIDISNVDTFAAAIQAAMQAVHAGGAAVGAATGVAWLDLGEVGFVDAGACRALGTATSWFRHGGGHVLVVAPQPTVERILRLLAIDQLPGLEVIGGDP
jgi:anti-anti-sigma factor